MRPQYGVTDECETLEMTPEAYKVAKESFVSDQTGSTLTHINLISLIAFSALSLFTAYRTRLSWLFPKDPYALFAIQFAFLVLPLLTAVTVGAQGTGTSALKWNVAIAVVTLTLSARFPAQQQQQEQHGSSVKQVLPLASPLPSSHGEHVNEKQLGAQLQKRLSAMHAQTAEKQDVFRLAAVSTWRAHMMLMTVLCILAVDFQVFPRSLVKCETFGVSLVGDQFFNIGRLTLMVVDGRGRWVICVCSRSRFSPSAAQDARLLDGPAMVKGPDERAQVISTHRTRTRPSSSRQSYGLPGGAYIGPEPASLVDGALGAYFRIWHPLELFPHVGGLATSSSPAASSIPACLADDCRIVHCRWYAGRR